MLISSEIADARRFSTPWKPVGHAGLSPSIGGSSGKTKTGGVAKQGSPWLRWMLVQCALAAVKYDALLGTFYDGIETRKVMPMR